MVSTRNYFYLRGMSQNCRLGRTYYGPRHEMYGKSFRALRFLDDGIVEDIEIMADGRWRISANWGRSPQFTILADSPEDGDRPA